MSARTLALEIVTPDGCVLEEDGVEVVVLRRRERRFELGSEIGVLPGHAPMLVRMPIAPARYRRGGGETVHLALGGGFAEVKQDRVLVMTPRCERMAPGGNARAAARETCRAWARELRDLRAEMVGAG